MNRISLIAAVVATLGFAAVPAFSASTAAPENNHLSTVVSMQHGSFSRSVLDDSSTDNGSTNSDQGNQSQSSDDSD
ncbi:MAG: hypothetical protein ACYDHM_00905 [Acidiferrobacterales bacterium]